MKKQFSKNLTLTQSCLHGIQEENNVHYLSVTINTEHQPKSTLSYPCIQHISVECLHLLGTNLGSRDRAVNKTDQAPCPRAANIPVKERRHKQDN